jgi:predicted SprT family Zn-dependent metalloprotease
MGKRERNLAHLMIIAHKEGVPAAMEEFDRMMAEIQAKRAQNSQPA